MEKELKESVVADLKIGGKDQREPLQQEGGPIVIGRGGSISEKTKSAIVANYRSKGYTLVRFNDSTSSIPQGLAELANGLSLGPAFVPPLYAANQVGSLYDELGMNVITAGRESTGEPLHPAFQSRAAIEFHTDGTLQDIGEIKTVALICLESGASGGEIFLFDAVGAFLDLALQDWDLAKALLDDNALTRCSTVGNSQAVRGGPVFRWQDGEWTTRYSVTPRDHWKYEQVRNLSEARELLDERASAGSPYCVRLSLEPGEGLLIANERIAHARTAYRDSVVQQRRMLRALFRRRPNLVDY